MDFSTSSILPNSASPQHNPQAASVFGSHEFSFQPSIELLPNNKGAVAFVPDSSTVFREDSKLDVRTLPNGMKFIPWGTDNTMPYDIISKIEDDETLATCMLAHSPTCTLTDGFTIIIVQWAATLSNRKLAQVFDW